MVLARPGRPYDLIFASMLSVICGLASLLAPWTPGLWLPSLISIFFLPGYCVLSGMAPGKWFFDKGRRSNTVSTLERVIVSIVLSIFFVALISTVLSWSDWGLTTASAVLEVSGITVSASFIGIVRRSRLPAWTQFTAAIDIRNPFKGLNKWEGRITMLVAVILVASTTLALMANTSSTEPYAQLTITGASGTLSDLPLTAAVDQNLTVRVAILNKMNKDVVFNLTVGVNGSNGFSSFQPLDWFSTNTFAAGMGFVSNITITNGYSYSANLVFRMPSPGTNKLLFLLNGEDLHRDVWLYLTVT